MAAEHFYKLHPHNKRQCICKKLCKKVNVHIQNGNFSNRIDQPDTRQCDHDQDYNGKYDFRVSGNIVDSLVKMFPYSVVDFFMHKDPPRT